MAHNVVLIPGDGTGPELTEATRRVLEATGVEFDWDVREAGVALKGPITTPVGGGFRSVNVALRKELDMYAQIRPCKSYPGVRSRFDDVDLIIVRENTEDLYAGIEYEQGTPDAQELIDWIKSTGGRLRHEDAGDLDQADLDHGDAQDRSFDSLRARGARSDAHSGRRDRTGAD